MIFFKNATMYTTTRTESQNEIGQVIKTYVKNEEYRVNLQPIEESAIQTTWGSDIKGKYNIYTDVKLNVGDIVEVNEVVYEIEKAIYWNDYNLYSLIESDVEL